MKRNLLKEAADFMWNRKADENVDVKRCAGMFGVDATKLQNEMLTRIERDLKRRIAERDQAKGETA